MKIIIVSLASYLTDALHIPLLWVTEITALQCRVTAAYLCCYPGAIAVRGQSSEHL